MATTTTRSTRILRSLLALGGLFACIIAASDATSPSPAIAAAGDGITAYISPPFVQGPPSSASATIQDFNASNFCSSLGASNVGTFSGSCTTVASGNGDFKFGGANSTSDQPTIGGTASQFVAAWGSQVMTLTFPTNNQARYVGFWWSAGSAGNQVKFYSQVNGSDVLTATFTTNTLNTLLNTSGQAENSVLPPNPYPGTHVVTAIDGSQYPKGYYFGRPKDHTSVTPTALPLGLTSANVNDNIYSHAYLNVYASGNVSFSKIEFIGGGFEMDNVAISDQTRNPSPELILLQSVLGKSVDFRANGGSGSMAAQTSDTATNLTLNTFTRNGYAFTGWSTTPTGSVDYTDGANFLFSADTILHAQWTLVPYAVEYDEQGGNAVPDDTYTVGSSVTLPTAPTRANHTFLGWFTSNTGGTALGSTYSPSGTGPITLYAQWLPVVQPTTSPTTTVTASATTTVVPTPSIVPTSTTAATTTTTTASTTLPSLIPATTSPAVNTQAVSKTDLPTTGQPLGRNVAIAIAGIVIGSTFVRLRRREA